MITLIELFAGIGTQHYAFSSYADIDNIGISEIDPRPLKAYKVLNGDYNNFGDITKITELPYADIWTYSFPCTDLSIAGKQEGFSGEHSSLLYEVYRLLERYDIPNSVQNVLAMEALVSDRNQLYKKLFGNQENQNVPDASGENFDWQTELATIKQQIIEDLGNSISELL